MENLNFNIDNNEEMTPEEKISILEESLDLVDTLNREGREDPRGIFVEEKGFIEQIFQCLPQNVKILKFETNGCSFHIYPKNLKDMRGISIWDRKEIEAYLDDLKNT